MSISILSVQLFDCDVFIGAVDVWEAYATLLTWAREESADSYKRMLLGSADLVEALRIGWEVVSDERGNIVDIRKMPTGISPFRLAVMLDLFTPLAPFVTAGANLVITHDDSNAGLYEVELHFDGVQAHRETRRLI
jgi:hypothetical protein